MTEFDFQSIKAPTRGLYKEKGSKFIAYAFPIKSVDAAIEYLNQIKKQELKARHHCFAYRLDTEGLLYRSSDDGEPSGTAGKPILGQIDSFKLTDTLVIVARYFGGKLLGAAGLAQAYKASAMDALSQARIIRYQIFDLYKITFDYQVMGKLMNSLSKGNFIIESQNFDNQPSLQILVKPKEAPSQLDLLVARTLEMHKEEVEGQRSFELMKCDFIEKTARAL